MRQRQRQRTTFRARIGAYKPQYFFAGVFCNFLFAWALISLGFVTGMPAPAGMSLPVENPQTVITTVLPGSPAAEAGIRSGDAIVGVQDLGGEVNPQSVSDFIADGSGPIIFDIERGENVLELIVTPEEGIIEGKRAIGVSMDTVGIVHLAPHKAIYHGLIVTSELTYLTAKALGGFILDSVRGRADLAQVTGPVGLVGLVGDVRELGFAYIISFTAIISINLALINLVPFPALDGGRLLFVAIEALRRKPIPARVFNALNTVGFALLILLMIIITARDIKNIF